MPQAVVRARFQLARLECIRASAWWARRDRGQLALRLIFGLAAVVSGPNAIAGVPKRAFSAEQLATVRSLIPMRTLPPPPTGSG